MSPEKLNFVNNLYSDEGNLPIAFDITYIKDQRQKPVIIFIHGFKGFKDWGTFDLMAQTFAKAGFVFIKFNFSHNGTTPENPTEITRPDLFRNNNFSKELNETGQVIDLIYQYELPIAQSEYHPENIHLIGHSRGGGIAILKASEDPRVNKIVSWAAINDFESGWSTDLLEKWKNEGVHYIYNGRTGEYLPLDYQIVEDYFHNRDRLKIPKAVKNMDKPMLAIHGKNDETLPFYMLEEMKSQNPEINTLLLEEAEAGHTFGAYHPYEKQELPDMTAHVIDETISFLKH